MGAATLLVALVLGPKLLRAPARITVSASS
jgi:hypothetical protein